MSSRGEVWFLSLVCGFAAVFLPACGGNKKVSPQKPVKDGSTKVAKQAKSTEQSNPPERAAPVVTASGRELYLQHCAACHGEVGDGDGIASKFLHPRPRDFRGGQFLLVSTASRFPSHADLDAVIARGMPGSAMPSFAHLTDEERRRVAAEVLRLCREGVRDSFVQSILENDEITLADIDQKELDSYVSNRTNPGPETEVPDPPEMNAESIERGKLLYVRKNCQACHGEEGKGDGKKDMVDRYGLPTKPRDFTRGIFKGGHDPKSLYRRVAYGMPGSAMPSHRAIMTPEEIFDVVHFTLSLSDEDEREAAVLQRKRLVAKFVEQLPSSVDAEEWKSAEPQQLRMTPLWWRHGADPDLSVQALHDGVNIAFRLQWRDSSHDMPKHGSVDPPDIAGIQLYRGTAEPFIGMGNFASPVDVWRWSSRLPPPPRVEPSFLDAPEEPSDDTPTDKASDNESTNDEPDASESPTDQPKDEGDEPKRVRVLTKEDQRRLAGSITGRGAGNFSLEPSQLVEARGQWRDGQWVVELMRPLVVKNTLYGISLEPGCDASVAFAIWNGSEGDKGGRKAITIWQDLHIEPTESK